VRRTLEQRLLKALPEHLIGVMANGSAERRKPGRPRKANELSKPVIRLAHENLTWGCTMIYLTVFNDVPFGCPPSDG
jgi:hypothetical protein